VTQKTKVEVLTAKAASDNDAHGSGDDFRLTDLLVSASCRHEWELAIRAGVDWIDLKNPSRGPLGRPDFAVANEFANRMKTRNNRPWSIAGGELAEWHDQADSEFCSLLGNEGYIKWALAGCARDATWREKLKACLGSLPSKSQAILVHYADYQECNAPSWDPILEAAREHQMRYVLIDTASKNGRGLLDHATLDSLKDCIQQAQGYGIGVAIAGSMRLDQLPVAAVVGAMWVGVRGAVCSESDRTSPFCLEKLERAVAIVRACPPKETRRESIHVLW